MIEATGDQVQFTSIYDESLTWLERGLNVRISMATLGPLAEPAAPAAALIHVFPGPGDRLRSRHAHPVDAINLVLHGAMYMDGEWIRPGQAKVVGADVEYGDALPSADGVIFLEIFASRSGATPTFPDPEDQAYYQNVHGSHLEQELKEASA